MERNVPKLRFKGFNDEWRETTFKNIFNNFEYGMNSAAIEFDGKNKYIRITDIDESSNKYSKDNMVSPDGILEDKFLVKENDIASLLIQHTNSETNEIIDSYQIDNLEVGE